MRQAPVYLIYYEWQKENVVKIMLLIVTMSDKKMGECSESYAIKSSNFIFFLFQFCMMLKFI